MIGVVVIGVVVIGVVGVGAVGLVGAGGGAKAPGLPTSDADGGALDTGGRAPGAGWGGGEPG